LAAGVLGRSLRQAQRLEARYRDSGGGAVIHKSRVRAASNKSGQGVHELMLELVRQNRGDVAPTLARETRCFSCRNLAWAFCRVIAGRCSATI
jgi:hypothetical protein